MCPGLYLFVFAFARVYPWGWSETSVLKATPWLNYIPGPRCNDVFGYQSSCKVLFIWDFSLPGLNTKNDLIKPMGEKIKEIISCQTYWCTAVSFD